MEKLQVVIVNYLSSAYITNLLYPIQPFSYPVNVDTFVVDNSVSEREFQNLSHLSKAKLIPLHYNAGFARANNAGIKASQSDVVLLLNPDTLIENNAVSVCYERFIKSDHVACGVQLLNEDRTPQISGSRFITGGINHFLPLPFLGKLVQVLGKALSVKPTSVKEAGSETEVDWINGAFLMVKRSAIEQAGMLDEDFFLYAEEIEWCSRLGKVGTLCIYGDLHVIHLEGRSANKSFGAADKGYYNLYDKKGRQIMVSNFLRIRKQYGVTWFVIHVLVYTVALPVFFIGLLIQTVLFMKGYSWKQFAGYSKNLLYLLGLVPKMISNRPHFYKAI